MVSLNSSTNQLHKPEKKHCVAAWLLRPVTQSRVFPPFSIVSLVCVATCALKYSCITAVRVFFRCFCPRPRVHQLLLVGGAIGGAIRGQCEEGRLPHQLSSSGADGTSNGMRNLTCRPWGAVGRGHLSTYPPPPLCNSYAKVRN